jgi:hypothetical protein
MPLSCSADFPVAPGTGQSSDLPAALGGHLSKHPNVITRQAREIISGVTSLGVLGWSSIPISRRSMTTTGFIAAAGCTPALSALQPSGALALNIASDKTLRKVFSTQANSTTGIRMAPIRPYGNPAAAFTNPR